MTFVVIGTAVFLVAVAIVFATKNAQTTVVGRLEALDRTAEKVGRSAIHELIVKLGFPVIYTTNYDRYLELAHEVHGAKFTKVANIGEMTAATPARALGLADVGELAVGRRADLVGLSADLAVEAVYRSGDRVTPWHDR